MQPFDERYFLEVKDSAEFTGKPENAFKNKARGRLWLSGTFYSKFICSLTFQVNDSPTMHTKTTKRMLAGSK